MCGIAGVLEASGAPADRASLTAMTDALSHRGPDGAGQFVDGELGLGHRRLAVIDVTDAGSQPMHSDDGRWVIVFNGEIYNYRELRSALEKTGVHFRSRSDTEVLLYALATWGVEALPRLNGMFAFALWDSRERSLLLARDRMGIKPLYYWHDGGHFAFASEIKAIRRYPSFRSQLDRGALAEYLTFQNFVTDRTFFEGVSLLPAGHLMVVSTVAAPETGRSGPTEPVPYWRLSIEPDRETEDPREYLEELDRLFEQAVLRQLVSDVPLGAYLSGGLDSGSIVAAASRHSPGMDTFTVGFAEDPGGSSPFDERAAARRTASALPVTHHEVGLGAEDLAGSLRELVWHLEVPRAGQSYPNLHAARLARRHATVALAGTGGDELFGGYPWRYAAAHGDGSGKGGAGGFRGFLDRSYRYWQRLLPESERTRLLAPLGVEIDCGGEFRRFFDRVGISDTIRHSSALSYPETLRLATYFDALVFLPGLLAVEDALSMSVGLEVRVPFLDNDVVDFATRLPAGLKATRSGTGRDGSADRRGKLLLRHALGGKVPPEIAQRPKQGFSGPDGAWFRGPLATWVGERLVGDERLAELVDLGVLRGCLEDHIAGRRDLRLLIWSMLCLGEWCALFL